MLRLVGNYGHSFDVLPNIHPTEADKISKTIKDNQGCDRLGTLRDGRVPCIKETRGPWDYGEYPTKVPTMVYQDGRPLNHLAVQRFRQDPCSYYKNVYPWTPQPPRVGIPATGAYRGLGKPPVRQFYKLTPKRVTQERVMPSYELLRPDNREALCHFYKDAC